jgi:glycosyltransferase involved in cell wall biosynthesis
MASKVKYIYISNLGYDGTVFITQVLDWLHLYNENEVLFDLYVSYPVQLIKNPDYLRAQKKIIKDHTGLLKGFLYLFPSRGVFATMNSLILLVNLFRELLKNDKVVIFSRAFLGKEINLLKRIFPQKIFYIYDCRAASAEEKLYDLKKGKNYSNNKFEILAHVYQLERETLKQADKVFCVSNVLKNYLIDTYDTDGSKFLIYPCLADEKKFFLNENIRNIFREKLGFKKYETVILYAGGFNMKWHISEFILDFYNLVAANSGDFKFLFLSSDLDSIKNHLESYPILKNRCTFLKVKNEEVNNYLNAADFGVLFREDTIMNNVASPTKFAEYVMAGLPVLISENVGDFSNIVDENKLGILVRNSEMRKMSDFDLKKLDKVNYDRKLISEFGLKFYAKSSILKQVIDVFNSLDKQ